MQQEEKCTDMNNDNDTTLTDIASGDPDKRDGGDPIRWYAIRTDDVFAVEKIMVERCDQVYLPTRTIAPEGRKPRVAALIPHVMFLRATLRQVVDMEQAGRRNDSDPDNPPLWIYRNPGDTNPCAITERSIHLLRLLTGDTAQETCRIYNPQKLTVDSHVRIIGGPFEGYEGFVKRIGRDRRVIVEIQGLCMVILPRLHPDLLEPLD